MRHVAVRRSALVLGGVFVVCAGLFAWAVSRETPAVGVAQPASAPAGAVLFGTFCASCHTAESLRPSVTGPGANREELETFLAEHGDASEEQDRLILDYLSGGVPAR